MAFPDSEHFSFECPACRSTLSIPVALQGVTGPCPHCLTIIAAPPLPVEETNIFWESPPVNQPYDAPIEAENSLGAEWGILSNSPAPPAEDLSTILEWEKQRQAYLESQQPPPAQIPTPAALEQEALASWQQLTGGTPSSLQVTSGPEAANVIPLPPPELSGQRRPWTLRVGLLIGLAGVGLASALALKPNLFALKHDSPSPVEIALPTPPVSHGTSEGPQVSPPASNNQLPALAVPEEAPLVVPPEPSTNDVAITPKEETPPQPPPEEVKVAVTVPTRTSPLIDPEQQDSFVPRAKKVGEKELLLGPRKALENFLSAPNWKERIKYAQYPEATKSKMEEYYQSHADGPVKVDSVDYLTEVPTPDGKSAVYVFRVYFNEGFGFPVSIEKFGEDFRVDWSLFVEFKDFALPKFFEKYSSEPMTFHGILKRAHHFGSDVPDQDSKMCFKFDTPVQRISNNIWVNKSNTELIAQLGERVTFQSEESYVAATLRWVKEDTGEAYVSLVRIVKDGWRIEPTKEHIGSTR